MSSPDRPDASVETAWRVLSENTEVRYGIFGVISTSGWFPPRPFLDEFFQVGHDPCDQDGRMASWTPFTLRDDQYERLKARWIAAHPGTVESALGVDGWSDWVQVVLDQELG